MADFFESDFCSSKHFWQRRKLAPFFDRLFDRRISPQMARLRREAATMAPLKVLVVTVTSAERMPAAHRILNDCSQSHHAVTTTAFEMGDRGKFGNVNRALERFDIGQFDWLIVSDDDVALPEGFLDAFLLVASRLKLQIAQPAHRCLSYTSFNFNYRRWNSLGRITRYVEDGPVTAFHRDIFDKLLPFHEMRWSWATDLAWSAMARADGIPIGIVDCTPIGHLRPVGRNYPQEAAVTEARAFLAEHHITPKREEMFVDTEVLRSV